MNSAADTVGRGGHNRFIDGLAEATRTGTICRASRKGYHCGQENPAVRARAPRSGWRATGSLLGRRLLRGERGCLDHFLELVVVDDLRPHGIDEVDHLIGHPVEEAD